MERHKIIWISSQYEISERLRVDGNIGKSRLKRKIRYIHRIVIHTKHVSDYTTPKKKEN